MIYTGRSGDNGVTEVNSGTQQGELLPTIYPKV